LAAFTISHLICSKQKKEERCFACSLACVTLFYDRTSLRVTRKVSRSGTVPHPRSNDPSIPMTSGLSLSPSFFIFACLFGAFPFDLWFSLPSGRDRQGLLREHASSRNFSVNRALKLEGSLDFSFDRDKTENWRCERREKKENLINTRVTLRIEDCELRKIRIRPIR